MPNTAQSQPGDSGPQQLVKRLLPVAILLAGLVAFFAFGLHRQLTFEALREHRVELAGLVETYGIVAALAAVAIYALSVAFSLPIAALMTPLLGFLFGWIGGSLLSVIGATLGATLVFLAARSAFAALFRARVGSHLQRLEAGFRRDAFSYLLFLRLVPVFPFWLVNVVPALFRMPLVPYVAATAIGIVPGALVYASVGAGLGTVLDRGEQPDWSLVSQPHFLLPVLGLAALSLLPVLYGRFKRSRHGG